MISKHIFTSDVVSGKAFWLNNLQSTGNLVTANGDFVITDNAEVLGNLLVEKNLTVNGTTTTINTVNLTVDDHNIELGSVENPTDLTATGGGITLKGSTDKTFNWQTNFDKSWVSSENLGTADGKYIFTDKVRARDAAGLLLQDDGGNGITIADGGNVSTSSDFAVGNNLLVPGTTSLVGNVTTLNNISAGGNITVADGKYITTDKIVARDSAGLLLQDDSGNGITIADGGNTSVSHAFLVGGNTTIGGNTSIAGTTYHGGAATFNDNVTINSSKTLQAGNITVADGKYITTDKIVARDSAGLLLQDDSGNGITIADGGNVSTSSDFAVGNNLLVPGTTSLVGNVTTINNISAGGNITVADGKYITTDRVRARDAAGLLLQDDSGNGITIADGGNTSVSHAFLVGGNTTIGGNTSIAGTTYHGGAATFNDNLTINSSKTLQAGNITVADNKYITTDKIVARDSAGLLLQDDGGNGITIANGGNASVSHAFLVGGNTTIGGNTSIAGTTYHGGAATFNDNVTINASKTFNAGDVNIAGSTTFQGATVFEQNVVISGDFNVTSETPMTLEQGQLEIQTLTSAPQNTTNQLYNVDNVLYWNGVNLVNNPNNTYTAGDNLTLSGNSFSLASTVTIADDLTVSDKLFVAGTSTLIGNTIVNGTLTTFSNLIVDAEVIATSNIISAGDVVAFSTSDKKLKNNISNISDPINKIKQINGVNFEWSDKQSTYSGKDVGVIAQEIKEVLPEVVAERDNGYLAVKYEKIIPLLIEAIKEQQKEIEVLKSKIK